MLRRRLYPHQLRARAYACKQRHPALLMRMRLGKTPVAIRTILEYTPRNRVGLRVLVVAPGSALGSWERELRAEGERSIAYLEGSRSVRLARLRENVRWFLLNSDGGWLSVPEVGGVGRCPACEGHGTRRVEERRTDGYVRARKLGCSACGRRGWLPLDSPIVSWDAVVVDESTSIKNPKARVTRFFLENFRDVPHRWILSGEPTPEGPLNAWCQIAFLDGSAFGHDSYWGWRESEFSPTDTGWGWMLDPERQARFDRMLGARAFVMRYEDAGFFVKRVDERRDLRMPLAIWKAYRTAQREFILEWKGEEKARTMFACSRWHWLRQMCSGFVDGKLVWDGKVLELVDLLNGELRSEPVVVWFAYNQEIAAVSEALRAEKIGYEAITGAVSKAGQRHLIERFGQGWVRVLLVQSAVDKGLRGARLDSASTAIYFSNNPSQEIRTQSEGRLIHMSKTHPNLYIDFAARGTVDEDLADLLAEKGQRSDGSMARAVMERVRQRIAMEGRTG